MLSRHVAAVVLLAGITSAIASNWKPPVTGAGPAFRSQGDRKGQDYILAFSKAKLGSEEEYDASGKTRYTLNVEGSVNAPPKLDVVAVRKRLQIRQAIDANGRDLVKLVKSPSTEPGTTGATYNAFYNSVANVELPISELTRHATAIQRMTLETTVVIASKRESKTVPAVVMEEYRELLEGVYVRVHSLEMTKDRKLTVGMLYKRPEAGTDGPFPEAVYALDPNGVVLGGGRWTEGDPFGKATKFMAEFKLAGDEVHKNFRVTFVTENTTRVIAFEIKDPFTCAQFPKAADLLEANQ